MNSMRPAASTNPLNQQQGSSHDTARYRRRHGLFNEKDQELGILADVADVRLLGADSEEQVLELAGTLDALLWCIIPPKSRKN